MEIKLTIHDLKEERGADGKLYYSFELALPYNAYSIGEIKLIGTNWCCEYTYEVGCEYMEHFTESAKTLEQLIEFINDTFVDEYEIMGSLQRTS